jgi:GNAT superfamily N-acetyltransferase
MAASDPDGPPVRSALLLSGLFQLEPLTHLPVGRLLGLTPENVAALSPLRRAPRPGVRVGVAVGALESEEFKRQSAELANAWSAASLTIAGANHFDLLEGLISGALLDFARVTAGDAAQPAKAPPGVEISRATSRDVEDIVALTDAAQDPDGGGLSQRMPAPLVHRFIEAMPCVVARREGTLVGVLLAQPRPQDDSAGPVTRAMLDAYPGGPDAYVYGPIAVVPEERGRGLAQALAAHLSELTGGREGILFIAAANAVSLKAHRKMGAKEVAGFTWEGRDFLVFSLR